MSYNSEIKAIVLYGSYARGDSDVESDKDICVFTDKQDTVTEDKLRTIFPSIGKDELSLTTYCQRDLTAMIDRGSLFLWHLKLEGKILYGRDYITSQLDKLKPFKRHHNEIVYYSRILSEILTNPSISDTVNEFDLSFLFTIARNTCMILAHKAGEPAFGRISCYQVVARIYNDFPLDKSTYIELSKWKSVYERGSEAKGYLPSAKEMSSLFDQIQKLLEYADEYTR